MDFLKTALKNDIFGSEKGSGFGEPGGTSPPKIPKCTLLGIVNKV